MFLCLRHPDAGGRLRWLLAGGPLDLITARTPAEVPGALAEIEAAALAGMRAAGFLTYEAAPAFDPALRVSAPGALPCLCFALFREVRWADALPDPGGTFEAGPWEGEWTEAAHRRAVEAVRDYIARGHTYQVNLTHRLRAPFRGEPFALFRALHRQQPTAFSAFLDRGEDTIVSVSPELFFERSGDCVTTRPMKGTAPRGRHPAEDARNRDALLRSQKDRAENAMIVDMMRNDLGRVARAGSVRVASRFDAEAYPSVWQLTSTVTARTDAPFAELLAALFPCASVTGAPKVRTMEIIRELETSPRGIYTGCIGTVGPGRAARFSVAIRTAHIRRDAGSVSYGTGGGIVWDSEPAEEWRECVLKSQILSSGWAPFRLLETIRWTRARGFFLLEGHLRRLRGSAVRFGFPFPEKEIRRTLAEAARGFDARPMRLRLLLDPDDGPSVEAVPFAPERPRPVRRLALAGDAVDPDDVFLYHKTTRRETYERARAEHPEADDVILRNPDGRLTETTIANLVVKLDSRLLTPPVSDGLLAGVFRQALLDRGRITEASLTPDDLAHAEGLWCVNALRGWMPAVVV